MNLITLFQKKLSQIRSILSGDTGDQCFLQNIYLRSALTAFAAFSLFRFDCRLQSGAAIGTNIRETEEKVNSLSWLLLALSWLFAWEEYWWR